MLVLYYHPLASFCWKALIALHEKDVAFEPRLVDLADPDSSAEMLSHWPVGKFPVLWDPARGEAVPETSIIVEYLDAHHPGAAKLIPADADAAIAARLWDRFFDLYVHTPMQRIVAETFRPAKDPYGEQEARRTLALAYDVIEQRMPASPWAAGTDVTIADCAAFPALFYARTLEPFGARAKLAGYFERLLTRPSIGRVLAEAKPWFPNYPYRDALEPRFL